jgi:dTDP-4-amino-4,6-dideoxygalactose transaminase
VVSTDKTLLGRAKHLAAQARNGEEYVHDAVGYNYRMTNVEAAVGLAQMERLEDLLARKRRIRTRYDEAFAGLPGAGRFPQPSWARSAYWLSGLTLPAAVAGDVRRTLKGQGISAGAFWRPVHTQAPYATAPRTAQTVAEAVWSTIVMLPCSTSLTDSDQNRVIEAVRGALAGNE